MALVWGIFILCGWLAILAHIFYFTALSSRGNPIVVKVVKFFGLLISFMPIIAIFMYVIFRGRPSGYGEKCGVMGLIGLAWYALLQAGRRAFLS